MRWLAISCVIATMRFFLPIHTDLQGIATAAQGTGRDWLELDDDMQLLILVGLDKDLRDAGMACPTGKTTYGQMYATITSLAKRHKDMPMRLILMGYYKGQGCTVPDY